MSDWTPPSGSGATLGGGPAPNRRRRWPWIVGGVILLLIIVGSAENHKNAPPPRKPNSSHSNAANSTKSSGLTNTHTTASTATAPATTNGAPNTPHIGQVAKDGDFAFTIRSVQCGVTHLGATTGTGYGLSKTAPAGTQWCLVKMHVLNDKTSSQSFYASNQYAIDALHRQLSATTGALFYLPNGSASESSTVNPGVSITVTVPYQLATSDSISKFVLHDSLFSGGVSVYNVGT